jgi:Zn finger protein HypA/HybF involved in hydrogenase expression
MNIEINNSAQQADQNNQSLSLREVRFRCPSCQKLYRTSADVFEGNDPEFDCSNCATPFTLSAEQDMFGLFVTTEPKNKKQSFDVCPKCSSLKPHKSDECPSCGVYASRYLELQKSESPVLFELNQQWQKVVTHFDEDQYHQDFLNKCHLKMALNFSFQKYSELQKTMGFDSLCEKYIRQIELRLEQQFKAVPENTKSAAKISQDVDLNITQVIFMTIGSIGMILLIYNKFVPTFPNFNGLVMMLTVLAFGIGLFSSGKSSIKF